MSEFVQRINPKIAFIEELRSGRLSDGGSHLYTQAQLGSTGTDVGSLFPAPIR